MFILKLSAVLLCFPLHLFAIPIELGRRDVSPDLFATLNLYEQYSAAAYCPDNNNSPNSKLSCTSGSCPLVEAANTNSVLEFQNTSATDATGFLAIDSSNKLIVLSFRGSESIRNYLTDLIFPQVPIDICAGCFGDAGFWASWVEARSKILTAMKAVIVTHPSYKIVATGHSLGGAIAHFAAAELRNMGHTVDLCTFGSPRVGDSITASYITYQSLGRNYRVTHFNDPVPRLPPRLVNYQHTSPEYYIKSANDVTVVPSDVQVCAGLGNSDCNGAWLVTDTRAHAWYFNAVSKCYPKDTVEV